MKRKEHQKPVVLGRGGRPGTVDRHPQVEQIRRELVEMTLDSKRFQKLGEKYGVGWQAMRRFEENHLTPALRQTIARHVELVTETNGLDVMASLGRALQLAERMLTAADAWLRDPLSPEKYFLGPRDYEVEVIWERITADGRDRGKEKLSTLLGRVHEFAADYPTGMPQLGEVKLIESKHADPRKLLLEAIAALKPVAETLGKASGQIKPDRIDVGVVIAQATSEQLAGTKAFQAWWDGFETRLLAEGVTVAQIDRALAEPAGVQREAR